MEEKRYEYKGKLYTARELSAMSGLSSKVIRARIRLGKSVEWAVTHEKRGKSRTTGGHDGSCRRYDCLHQDGSGTCSLRKKMDSCNSYDDAFEYYYGDAYRRKVPRGNTKTVSCGSGSAVINTNVDETDHDRWRRERGVLLQ